MGKTYTATLNIAVQKQHTCVGCEAKYSYVLARKISGSGSSAEAASENAEQQAVGAVENDVDFHPCPHCGLVQPEMTANVRSGRFTTGVILGVVAVALFLILGLADVMQISTCAFLSAGIAGLGVLLNFTGCRYNPNSDLDRNKLTADDSVQGGLMSLDEPGTTTSVMDEHGGTKPGHTIGLALGVMAIAVVLSPFLMKVVRGWPENSTYPAVAGPGDSPTVYFDQQITSIKSMWRGSAVAQCRNADELDIPHMISATTKSSNWGNTISGKSVSNSTNAMWAQVHIPDDESLVKPGLLASLNGEMSGRLAWMVDRHPDS